MSVYRYAINLFSRWQLLVVVGVAVVTTFGFLSLSSTNKKVPAKKLDQTGSLSVSKTTTPSLSSSTMTSDIPPTSVSAHLQSQPNNPGESTTQPLQSNVNINDPSLANDPLVQSLNSSNP